LGFALAARLAQTQQSNSKAAAAKAAFAALPPICQSGSGWRHQLWLLRWHWLRQRWRQHQHQQQRRHVRYVALLLQHTRTTFSKMEYLEIFLNGKDVSHEVSKLQRCFSRSI
jgi:hypothetical protein